MVVLSDLKKQFDVDDLVNSFDDLPRLMSTINDTATPRRFHAMAPNQSIGMDSVMRSHRKIEVTESNTEKIERMAKQAVRVMDHLSRIPESPNKKPVREVEQTVELAKNKLAMLEKKGVDLNKFYSKYDVDRTGKVSYKDFSDTLVTLSSGIGKEEAHILAAKLDKTKSGSISYKNIIGALQEVERTTPQPSPNPKSNNDRRDQARSSSKHSQQNDYSDYSSFFDSMESSSLITTRESTSCFDTVKNADPKEAVSYQSLSPRVEAQDATKPPLSPELRGSRRHFYHARGDGLRSVADDLHREVPYEVDPPYGEVKKQRKRALSAPPRSARSMGKIISGDQLNSSNNEVVNNPEKRNNLRNAVDQAAKGLRPKQSHEGRITFDTIRNFASQTPVKEVQKHKKETGLIESRVVENAVVAQLGGRINTLRHMLKKHDLSNSGTVNKEEFATALKKSGVNLEKHQANELYELMTIDKSIRPVNVVENASGKALDIEEFVDRIQIRTTAPAFRELHQSLQAEAEEKAQHTYEVKTSSAGNSLNTFSFSHAKYGEEAHQLEEVRIMKKVLHATSKLNDPHLTFNAIESHHNGCVNQHQLKDALDRMGSNLTKREFSILMDSVDQTKGENIEISKFQDVIHKKVCAYDKQEEEVRNQRLDSFPHYTPTYRSSTVIHNCDQPIYDKISASRSYRSEQREMGKLQDVFQSNPGKVLAAFCEQSGQSNESKGIVGTTKHKKSFDNGYYDVEMSEIHELSVPELKRNLSRHGIQLCADDVTRLENLIERKLCVSKRNEKKKVSMENFCQLLDIPVTVNHFNQIELHNPRDVPQDGGIFSTSLRSQIGNQSVSTTFFLPKGNALHDTEKDEIAIGMKRRAKVPQEEHEHTYEPSKFWEMKHSSDNAMFCAYPMPSLRDPLPKKVTYSPGKSLDKYLMSKEHARLSKDQLENHQSSFLQRHQRNRTESDLGFTEGSMSDTLFTTASSQKSSRTIRTLGSVVSDISRSSRIRSSSAPARALRRQSSFSDSGGKSVGELLKRENKPNDKISAQIAKWASSSLKDYFDAKEKLGLSDNNSVHSGASGVVSTNSMDYQRGRSTTPQPVRSNYSSPMQSPNKEFVSLRRLYNVNRSTAAPFALDTD